MSTSTHTPPAPSRWFAGLVRAAAAPYRPVGRFAWHFARGKLGTDPAFPALLRYGLIPPRARVLDLGCGQGLLAAWLLAAQRAHASGNWPQAWPAPPQTGSLQGVELMADDVNRARTALGSAARFEHGDIRTCTFGPSDAVIILDVLHYIDLPAQDAVLRRVREALTPGGVLLLRVGDASAGLPFRISNWVDHIVTRARGHRTTRLHCRPLRDWIAALQALGFCVNPMPMSQGTPFANVLLVASLPAR